MIQRMLTIIALLVSAQLVSAMDCREMREPSQTLCFQNLTNQRLLTNILENQRNTGYPIPAPQENQNVYVCKSLCLAGNNNYYDTWVKEYFSRVNDGVTERLVAACLAALPNQAQRTGSRITKVECQLLNN